MGPSKKTFLFNLVCVFNEILVIILSAAFLLFKCPGGWTYRIPLTFFLFLTNASYLHHLNKLYDYGGGLFSAKRIIKGESLQTYRNAHFAGSLILLNIYTLIMTQILGVRFSHIVLFTLVIVLLPEFFSTLNYYSIWKNFQGVMIISVATSYNWALIPQKISFLNLAPALYLPLYTFEILFIRSTDKLISIDTLGYGIQLILTLIFGLIIHEMIYIEPFLRGVMLNEPLQNYALLFICERFKGTISALNHSLRRNWMDLEQDWEEEANPNPLFYILISLILFSQLVFWRFLPLDWVIKDYIRLGLLLSSMPMSIYNSQFLRDIKENKEIYSEFYLFKKQRALILKWTSLSPLVLIFPSQVWILGIALLLAEGIRD